MNTLSIILYQLLFLWLLIPSATSQALIDVRHRTVDDELVGLDEGLNDRVINHVTRDKFGYFYIVTQSGFQRYDGAKFENINYEELTNNALNPNDIGDLSTVDGHIIIHTSYSEKIFFIQPSGTVVQSINAPHHGQILCDKGILYLSKLVDNSYLTSTIDIKESVISKVIITHFLPTDLHKIGENLFIASDEQVYYYKGGKLSDSLYFDGNLISNSSNLFLLNKNSISTWDGNGEINFFHSVHDSLNLTTFHQDLKDNILLGYGTSPRFIDKFLLIDVAQNIFSLDSIINYSNKFLDIYTDDAKHKIMTVGYEGMHIFTFLQEGGYHFLKRHNLNETFGNIITGVATNAKNEIVFLQERSGVHHVPDLRSVSTNIMTSYKGGIDGFRRNGKLYFDTLSNTFYSFSYNPDNSSIIHQLHLEKKKAISRSIPYKLNDITLYKSYIYLAGLDKTTKNGKLSKYDFNKNYIIDTFSYPRPINSVHVRKQGKELWLSTEEGIIILNDKYQIIHTLNRHQNTARKIIVEDNIRLTADFGKYVLAGSIGGGCYIINPDDYTIVSKLDKTNGLTNNKVIGIIPDNYGNCWLATWNGLNVIDSGLNIIRTFHDYDCLPNNELNTKAVCKDTNGLLYFGTINGLLVIDPAKSLHWTKSNGIAISSIIQYNYPYRSNLSEVSTKSSSDSLKFTLILPDYYSHGNKITRNDIEFSITDNVGEIAYSSNSITLKNLKAGNGNIIVKSKYNNASVSTKVEIKRDFSTFLWVLFILALLMGLLYVLSLRVKQADLKKAEVSSRIANLELTALQSQMNPHFMFNALGAIQYFIQTHDIEKADEYLSNFAHLMRMTLESSKNRFITISNEIKLLDLYVGLEKVRFDGKFEYKIIVDENIDSFFRIPPMIAQPYVENAINHGLINLKDKQGFLTINVKAINDETLEVQIYDNGIGRKNAKLLKKDSHISRGMQIVRERMASFQTSDKFIVNEKIIDLEDENGSPLGTKIILTYKDLEK